MIDKALQASIKQWLVYHRGIEAVRVQMYDTDVEFTGCSCSGDYELSFIIGYWLAEDDINSFYAPRHTNVNGDPVKWFWEELPDVSES